MTSHPLQISENLRSKVRLDGAEAWLRDLPALGDHEQSLFDDLRFDRLGERVRLEQEKIGFTLVEAAVRDL